MKVVYAVASGMTTWPILYRQSDIYPWDKTGTTLALHDFLVIHCEKDVILHFHKFSLSWVC